MHDQVSSSTAMHPNGWENEETSEFENSVTQGRGQPKQKKPALVLRKQEELCHVCGDRASGYHYNALTCEGCKGFFRRSITKNAVSQCKYGNNCQMDMYMRRKCQECRLKKCLQVGMRPECVVPAYQCAVKQNARRSLKARQSPAGRSRNFSTDFESDGQSTTTESDRSSSPDDSPRNSRGRDLSLEQQESINQLVFLQHEFEQPSAEDLQKFCSLIVEDEDASEIRFREVTQMTFLTVKLIVEFSKRLPGFAELKQEDQVSLLKACSCEVMMLRTARRYDFATDTVIFANNQPYTRENYYTASIGATADPLFNFCRRMCTMKVDNAEYALITAVVIFSDRPGLLEPWRVEKMQEFYLCTLQDYLEYRDPSRAGVNLAKLLGTLTELRTLGNINSEMCFSLKLENKKLPDLLLEIWN